MTKLNLIAGVILLMGIYSCDNINVQKDKNAKEMTETKNILLEDFNTPYGVPPFDQLKIEDYKPAYEVAIKEKQSEIDAIIANTDEPTFKNTIEAIELSGALLEKVDGVFGNLTSSNTNEEMEAIAQEVTPMVTALYDGISMNDALFQKVKAVYDNCDRSKLNEEQVMLLNETYKSFVRGGANLNEEDKAKLKEINKKLSVLSLNFGSNVLKETNKFEIIIDKKEDLAGLPEGVISAAAETAKEKGKEGKWIFTIQKASLIPVLSYADDRELRKKAFLGYTNKGDHNDELDNKENVKQMVNLRLEKAQLLGYKNYASYILEDNMAKTPEKAYALIADVMKKATVKSKEELKDLQKLAAKDGIEIEPWDWWYYTEKLRKAKYDLSEEEMKPYFKLENVRNGMFDLVGKLYDLSFKLNNELPKMDPKAEAYEVYRKGELISILYIDYYPRASKRAGAWMTAYRKQYRDENGKNIIPIISLTTNFTPPTGDEPSLLNLDEVTTLFHEFGHGLHGMLSNCQYESLSGTSVARDFVELPSQILENWALQPEMLKSYALHYKTNEPMPDALIEKMQKAGTFNNGFVVAEFDGAAALDMAWHTITEPFTGNVNEFETKTMKDLGLIDEIVVRYRSTYYSHIFAGGYAAGYYAYLWTAVLDADAFGAFQETSLFDKTTADSFRENILSKGGTEDAEKMWLNFRGREPEIKFYLDRMGLE
jgi:peptidyl-dipeptidase Dcp